jgi:hypothetical protein
MAIKEGAAAIGVVFIALLLGIAWKLSYADTLPGSTTAELSIDHRALTRHTTLPTSSATSKEPRLSIATPTGRP